MQKERKRKPAFRLITSGKQVFPGLGFSHESCRVRRVSNSSGSASARVRARRPRRVDRQFRRALRALHFSQNLRSIINKIRSSTMAPPLGIGLGPDHAVGRLIGTGAFGQVHAVVERRSGRETSWAAKLTKVPTKTTKKANSPAEVAHQRLWAEKLLYEAHLRPMCGTMIPRIPPASKGGIDFFYNDTGGTFFKRAPQLIRVFPAPLDRSLITHRNRASSSSFYFPCSPSLSLFRIPRHCNGAHAGRVDV